MIALESAPEARIAARSITLPPDRCGRERRLTMAWMAMSSIRASLVALSAAPSGGLPAAGLVLPQSRLGLHAPPRALGRIFPPSLQPVAKPTDHEPTLPPRDGRGQPGGP